MPNVNIDRPGIRQWLPGWRPFSDSRRSPRQCATLLGGLLCLLLAGGGCSFTGQEPGSGTTTAAGDSIRIARFLGDREAAISYTFDDGLSDHAAIAAPLLDRHGFRGTFFVCPGLIHEQSSDRPKRADGIGAVDWQTLRQLAGRGHEIGSHSWSHRNLRRCDEATLDHEIEAAHAAISERIGTPPFSFFYPYNKKNHRVRRAVYRHHHAARESQWDWGGPEFTTARANRYAERAAADNRWYVPMLHGIERGYGAFTSGQVFADHLAYISQRRNRFWVDTYGNIARYEIEREEVRLMASRSLQRATFTLTSSLDPLVFSQPLTVIIPVRSARNARAEHTETSTQLSVEVRPDRILVDVVPGSGRVTVTWQTAG